MVISVHLSSTPLLIVIQFVLGFIYSFTFIYARFVFQIHSNSFQQKVSRFDPNWLVQPKKSYFTGQVTGLRSHLILFN